MIKLMPKRKAAGIAEIAEIADIVNLTTNNAITQIVREVAPDATTTRVGVARLATTAETSTGTDSSIAVTPDGLAGSIFGTKVIEINAIERATSVAIGDGKADVAIPVAMNGMNLTRAQAIVITAGTTNATTVAIYNVTDSQEMLSSNISIASGATVGTVGTINTTYDDVATNDVLRIDVDAVSTTAPKGLLVILEFSLP